jgi:hypothetical protein
MHLSNLARSCFRSDQFLELDHCARFIEKAQFPAQIVLLEMGEKNVGLVCPGPIEAGDA